MTYKTIKYDVRPDGIATMTLNRPERLNCFSIEMFEEWRDVVQRVNALIVRLLKSRELEKKLPDLETVGEPLSAEQFGAWIRAEVEKWQKVLK